MHLFEINISYFISEEGPWNFYRCYLDEVNANNVQVENICFTLYQRF